MTEQKRRMIGALYPDKYAQELYDRLHKKFPKAHMTALFRALLGMWFDGKIEVKAADLKHYRLDARAYNSFGRPDAVNRKGIPEGAEGEGYIAADMNMPKIANSYPADSEEYAAWDKGWDRYFNTHRGVK